MPGQSNATRRSIARPREATALFRSTMQFARNPLALAVMTALGASPTFAADVNWVTDGDGNWAAASNWSSNPLLPGSADDVTLDVSGDTRRTATINTAVSISSLASQENLILAAGGGRARTRRTHAAPTRSAAPARRGLFQPRHRQRLTYHRAHGQGAHDGDFSLARRREPHPSHHRRATRRPVVSTQPNTAPDIARLVEIELTRNYLELIPAAIVTHLVGAALMLWPMQAGTPGTGWYVLYLMLNAARMLAWGLYRRNPRWSARPEAWVERQAFGLAGSGLMWGIAPWLFFANAPGMGQIYIFATIVVMAVGTTVVNAPFPRTRLAFALPALTLGAGRALQEGGAQYNAIGAVLLCSIPVVIYLGLQWGRMLRESISIRHEKTALVAELTQQKAAAEQANVARSEFFAAANHDLRQPVHALGLYAAALRDAEYGRSSAVLADKISESVEALEALFDQLLDIARIDSGGVTVEQRHFQLQSVFTRLEALYRLTAEQVGARLRFVPTDKVVMTDPALLERILSNLVANALRFAAGRAVLVGARQRGAHVIIEVRDAGPGIAPADQPRIFDEFVQLENPERNRHKGLGLGLATVRRLAGLLALEVAVVSAPARGSIFRVVVATGERAAIAPEAPNTTHAPRDVLTGRRFLVIEDEESVRDAMTRLFDSWGCESLLVSSAQQAIALNGMRPHAVIADFRLRSGETGIAAIAAVRAHYGAELPALLVTGDARAETLAAAQDAGCPLLTKPVRAARLRSALAHLLRA